MHSNTGYEPSRKHGGFRLFQEERPDRRVWKRNGGRKAKTLRSHRVGR